MKEMICELIRIQDCDNKIREIDTKKMEGPVKIEQLKSDLDAHEMLFQKDKDSLENSKKEKRTLEQTILDMESKVEKSQIKLSSIKSNKEYSAGLKEIENLEKEKTQLEDKVLQVMEQLDELEKKCLKNKDEQADLKKRFDQDSKEVEKELEILNEKLILMEKKRTEYCDGIDQNLFRKYLFLLERKGGVAIGPVIEGVCQSCHMQIPPQRFNELKKCQDLMSCPSCNRIIYWGEDEVFLKALGEE